MSSGDDEDQAARRVRTMQDLLRFCTQGTVSEDAPAPSPLDPERAAWLQNALKAFSVDIVQEMLQAISNIKKELQVLSQSDADFNRGQDSSIYSIVSSVDTLIERTEDLDIAADFDKIGGFDIIPPLLDSGYSQLQIKGCELVGELVQNHEPCQAAALRHGVLEMLIKLLDESTETVKPKALFACSCLIRSNLEALNIFVNKLDGFSVLLRAMQTSGEQAERLRTKASFLLSLIIGGHSDFKEILLRMGFIEQMVALLHQEWDQSHEHLLSSLLNFMTDFPQAAEEALRPQLKFRALLNQKLVRTQGKPEFQEEEGYCKAIFNLLSDSASDTGITTEMER
ncbi:hsp70-binding protein 1 [Folsomia candida]|uniref:Hsp70-binding protein 1 n=1 Tax=Folsomia candida TaxID=158441 RepID=A0A226F1J3_FOLCA|nr:hsp70-binding protein 1 [Folsomia candida]XP_021960827.1 hsp70-binding protein 1 [Folsomia candida]OXA63653.1 hypothetical protein Fcan01_03219 [Folsomia candida]